jgi:hypothetical protein
MAALSSDEQFAKVLAVTDRQFKGTKIQARFGPTGKMRFIIDEVSLKDSLTASGIEEADFRQIFHGEIGPLLDAIINDKLDEYVQGPHFVTQSPEDVKARQADQARLRERASQIEKTIITPELRARRAIKISSKHPRLRFYLWEIAKKFETSATMPYVTFSIETIRPETNLGFWGSLPFFPSESIGRTDTCTFDCDEGDLDDLIKTLQEAKGALSRAGKGTPSG